jgi:hypothetical protein
MDALKYTRFISRVAALTREISCSTLEINLVFPRTHVLFDIYSFFQYASSESLQVIKLCINYGSNIF